MLYCCSFVVKLGCLPVIPEVRHLFSSFYPAHTIVTGVEHSTVQE